MPKKTYIPKTLRIAVWNKYIGEHIGKSKCLCCNITDITQLKFHVGHIIAEANGGSTNIDNLKPICESCNKSMKTKNMDEFKLLLTSNSSSNNPIEHQSLNKNDISITDRINTIITNRNNLKPICESYKDGINITDRINTIITNRNNNIRKYY